MRGARPADDIVQFPCTHLSGALRAIGTTLHIERRGADAALAMISSNAGAAFSAGIGWIAIPALPQNVRRKPDRNARPLCAGLVARDPRRQSGDRAHQGDRQGFRHIVARRCPQGCLQPSAWHGRIALGRSVKPLDITSPSVAIKGATLLAAPCPPDAGPVNWMKRSLHAYITGTF